MTQIPPSDTPRLAPPGAGLPIIERLIGKAIFTVRRWTGTREAFTAQFDRERRAIEGLCTGRDEASLRRKVLIPRLRGLEDSSRFWSVYMTLEHLRIVNTAIAEVIGALTRGHVPPGQSSTAAVKPNDDIGAAVVSAYEQACDALLAQVAAHPVLKTDARYAHPWFGPLDAAGWHAMSAIHMGIHRAQIERILQ
jgi:hypothetical protein